MTKTYNFTFKEPSPSNLDIPELEKSFVGSLFHRPDAFNNLPDNFKSEHFGTPTLKIIFETMQKIFNRGEPVIPERVLPALPTTIPEEIRSMEVIGDIPNASSITTESSIYSNANTITTYYRKRFLDRLCDEFKADLYNPEMDIDVAVESHEKKLFDFMRINESKKAEVQLHVAEENHLDSLERIHKGEEKPISTGFNAIGKIIGGFKPSNLYILAGRPSMGKTALGTNMAYNVAKAGKNVLFFSLEMSAEQLGERIMSEDSNVPFYKFQEGNYKDNKEFNEMFAKTREVQIKHKKDNVGLFIDDTQKRTVASILSQARRFKRQHGLDLIVIDHLHIMKPEHSNPTMSVTEIKQLTGDLKALAKELKIPVLTLAQLNRELEKRDNKRPQMSDLRESGSIEQDGDVVMFVHRDEYFLEREKEDTDAWKKKMEAAEGKANIIFAKNRQGPIKMVNLKFNPELTKFSDLEEKKQ